MNIFLSYRRSDTQDLAGRIADRLRAVARIDRVFIDVDDIAPGVDFVDQIESALADSEVCLLLIGPAWCGASSPDTPARILAPRDFVRLEAKKALDSGLRVLPLLANGATMPEPEELPEDLHALARLNALSIRHAYFDHDLRLLLDTLLERRSAAATVSYSPPRASRVNGLRGIAGAVGGLALALVIAVIHDALMLRSLEETLGGEARVWLFITLLLGVGAVLGGRRPPR
jgi:hypothetical protein